MRDFTKHPRLRVGALCVCGIGTMLRGFDYASGRNLISETIVDSLVPVHVWAYVWLLAGALVLVGVWHRLLARYALNFAASLWGVWGILYFISWLFMDGSTAATSMLTVSGLMWIVAALADSTGPPPGPVLPKPRSKRNEKTCAHGNSWPVP